jgi:PIN domain nuclease of toxin-antitoxin system
VSLLLDTHIVLWWLTDDPTLADDVKDPRPRDRRLRKFSHCVGGRHQTSPRKLEPADLPEQIRNSGFRLLDITAEHGIAAGRLPMHHRDPFDRMLVAQAQLEGLTLVTRDANVQKYDVDVLSA